MRATKQSNDSFFGVCILKSRSYPLLSPCFSRSWASAGDKACDTDRLSSITTSSGPKPSATRPAYVLPQRCALRRTGLVYEVILGTAGRWPLQPHHESERPATNHVANMAGRDVCGSMSFFLLTRLLALLLFLGDSPTQRFVLLYQILFIGFSILALIQPLLSQVQQL